MSLDNKSLYLRLILFLARLLVATGPFAARADSVVVFNEIMYHPLANEAGFKWRLPSNTVIAAKGFLLVWADNQTNLNGSSVHGDLHANFHLSKNGDYLGLSMSDGTPLHSVVYEPQFQNLSQGLFPDGNTNACHYMTNWTPRSANQLAPRRRRK
jgi:hypothetical protein